MRSDFASATTAWMGSLPGLKVETWGTHRCRLNDKIETWGTDNGKH